MEFSYLTAFIFEINRIIDSGKYQDISIGEVEEHIEKGDLVPYLKERLAGDTFFLSLFGPDEAGELTTRLQWILEGFKGDARKEMGYFKKRPLSSYCLDYRNYPTAGLAGTNRIQMSNSNGLLWFQSSHAL